MSRPKKAKAPVLSVPVSLAPRLASHCLSEAASLAYHLEASDHDSPRAALMREWIELAQGLLSIRGDA